MTTHNFRHRPLRLLDLRRWMRLNRTVYRTAKIDVLADGDTWPLVLELGATARELDVALSLRMDCACTPSAMRGLEQAQLHDLFLCLSDSDLTSLEGWLAVCGRLELSARLQVSGSMLAQCDTERLQALLKDSPVRVVNVVLFDAFAASTKGSGAEASKGVVSVMNEFVAALGDADIETNLIGLPFCHVDEAHWSHAVNGRQFFMDHQHYAGPSYELARRIYHTRPAWAGKALWMLLGRYTSFDNPIDRKLLPWLLEKPWLRARVWAWHKLTRHLRLLGGTPREAPALDEFGLEVGGTVPGESCSRCALRYLCDGDTAEFKQALPGLDIDAIEGESHLWPLHFAVDQPKYYDAIDRARLAVEDDEADLAAEATRTVDTRSPDLEVSPFDYKLEGVWCHRVQGGVRWHSFTNTEKVTTPLAKLAPPFTLSVTFGGGLAEYIGFSFGRHARIMCPMEAYSHTLILHVASDGRYVLLRDGRPVCPSEFEGLYYAPLRLGNLLEPRLSAWNIEGTLVSQSIFVWRDAVETSRENIRYSVVVVCARYARRLQAALLSLANQRGIDLSALEVIVAYAPGIDPTDDVLDTLEASYPELHVVRVPYPVDHMVQKGLLINECARMASGEWVALMDADILLPPELFAEIGKVADSANFIAPDGRMMLSPETTAKVLLGALQPWRDWEELLREAGEFRYREVDGVPIGYFQCVRKSCFDKVAYDEYAHFEGADWQFGVDVREHFGKELRLQGLPVLHMDHGGSKWYGTMKQY